jgi:hypothetical protein
MAASVRAPAHEGDENDGPDDGDDDRTDAAKAVGKECEHTALSRAASCFAVYFFPA